MAGAPGASPWGTAGASALGRPGGTFAPYGAADPSLRAGAAGTAGGFDFGGGPPLGPTASTPFGKRPEFSEMRPWLLTNRQKGTLFVIPLALSTVLYILFANVYYRSPGVVLSFVVIPVLFLTVQGVIGKGPPFNMWMVIFSLFSLFATTAVSAFAYERALNEYWRLYDSNSYSNVLPSEPASGYADGGKIIFADGTRVDPSKSLGFKDRDMYCVAPIVDAMGPSVVEFWAVGKNCCNARGVFSCDDAWDVKARSGVRVYTETEEYTEAIKMAEAFYGLGSVEKPIFVRWVVRPDRVEGMYYLTGVGIMFAGLFMQQLALACASVGLNVVLQSSLLFRS